MALKIYNSLTNQKEEFTPLEPGHVKMYVCGPTVYDEPHIGHLRSAYVFDVIRRYLESSFCNEGKGYKVTFVRNVTDVDDKIIEKARQNHPKDLLSEVKNVSQRYFLAYKEELAILGVQEPTKEPKATEYIPQMVVFIKELVNKGFAYQVDGDIYFEIDRYLGYGKLSHQRKDKMLESVRIDTNEKKRNSLDFALWKKAKEDEPVWNGPVEGQKGRPGWHIECSVMSMHSLRAETIDIHGGGRDLIFPHHENEIAQSECATGKQFVRYWMHHGLITRDGHKMSKSLHNYVTLRELSIKQLSRAEQLKFLFLGTHYAAPLDYSEERFRMEKQNWRRFYNFFNDINQLDKGTVATITEDIAGFEKSFHSAMDDDFNTPLALAVLHEMIHYARKSNDPGIMLGAANKLRKIGQEVFGIFSDKEELVSASELAEAERKKRAAEEAIEKRTKAKGAKDYKTADSIREKLLREHLIELIDLKGGKTIWREKI